MKILNEDDIALLKELAKMNTSLINTGFSRSKELGLVFLSNSITSFKELYIKVQYGDFVPSMCSEYRIFIVELLIQIDERYRDMVLNEILVPQIRAIGDLELLDIISHKQKKKVHLSIENTSKSGK